MDKITKGMIKALIARLEHISNPQPVRENKSTQDAQGEPRIETGHSEPEVPTALGVPKSPPTKSHYTVTCKPEKDWWGKSKPFVEIGILIVLGVYTTYTIKIYSANREAVNSAQEQTRIMRSRQDAPWVGLEENTVRPIKHSSDYSWSPGFEAPSVLVFLHYSIKNFGTAPAFRVKSMLYVDTALDSTIVEGFFDPCQLAELQHSNSGKVHDGAVVFPGSPVPLDNGANMVQTPPRDLKGVRITLCIAYQDSTPQWHHSRYTFHTIPVNGPEITFLEHPGWSYLPFTGVLLVGATAN